MSLQADMESESVSELALREPVTARLEITLREAIERMRENKLGCVIAVDEAHKPVGMFTESMLTQLVATQPSALTDQLGAHLSTDWPQVALSDKIALVLKTMQTRNERFLSVVDADGRLVGLTGQKGLIEYVAEHFPDQVMVQRIGGTPYTHQREGA